jgi:hypothetical protein
MRQYVMQRELRHLARSPIKPSTLVDTMLPQVTATGVPVPLRRTVVVDPPPTATNDPVV